MKLSKPESRIALLLLCFAGSFAPAAWSIEIADAWIAEAPPVSKVNAGYFNITNDRNKVITLEGVSSDAYSKIELHLSTEKDGVASMQHIGSVAIPPGETLSFKPGSYHLMLFNPVKRLRQGDEVSLQFRLDSGDTVPVTAVVRKHQAAGSGHDHHDHHKHHHHHNH